MNDLVRRVTFDRAKVKDFVKFRAGDTVGVYYKVKEGQKERIQLFKGVVLKLQGDGMGRSFTVRKMSSGVGVERTFPFSSPFIDNIELISRGIVRRSRLYFLRELSGRAARLKSELVVEPSSKKAKKKKSAAKEAGKEATQTAAPATAVVSEKTAEKTAEKADVGKATAKVDPPKSES